MAQRRHNFISGAAVLAFAVAVTKVLGALYKIPLGNLLDKEGMAHFYAAYNIYSLLLVLSTAGLPLALSRLVSRAAAQGRLNAQRRIFRTALALLTAIGLGTTFYNPNWRVVCYTFLGTVFTVVAQGALNVLLNVYGIPTLTFPFVVAAWIFLLPNIDLLPKNYQS